MSTVESVSIFSEAGLGCSVRRVWNIVVIAGFGRVYYLHYQQSPLRTPSKDGIHDAGVVPVG
jgi:hypothetical protein